MPVSKQKGNLTLVGISSDDILSLIKSKHERDVVVPECKNGETWGARDLLKMDAWILRRSYRPLTMIGYEIKVTRQDFETDQKWTGYLDLCHEFYFACPAGLIRATDLPQRVGIVWASKNRLFTKRKAERVEPDSAKLIDLLTYVVMARSRIVANMFERDITKPTRAQAIILDVQAAEERKELAHLVSGHVRKVYQQIRDMEVTLRDREAAVQNFRMALEKLGITWNPEGNYWAETRRVDEAIREMKKNIGADTIGDMRAVSQSLVKVADALEKLL